VLVPILGIAAMTCGYAGDPRLLIDRAAGVVRLDDGRR